MSKRHSQHPPYTPRSRHAPIAAPPERTRRLPLQRCPTCGHPLNAGTTLSQNGTPPPGQPLWAVCTWCAGLAVLDQTTQTLRLPTNAELATCPPAHRELLARLRHQIRQHNAAWRQATTPLGA